MAEPYRRADSVGCCVVKARDQFRHAAARYRYLLHGHLFTWVEAAFQESLDGFDDCLIRGCFDGSDPIPWLGKADPLLPVDV
jgi:hypothetical protein